MATYVMRGTVNGATSDVETPPVLRKSDARVYAQQWADELGSPVILFRDNDGQLRHVDNVRPTPPDDYTIPSAWVYLVIDPTGGPVRSFPRERAYEYARNTASLVARVSVVTDRREEAR